MEKSTSDISQHVRSIVEVGPTPQVYMDDFCYVNALNSSAADQLKLRIDLDAGLIDLGTFNGNNDNVVSVPLASISGNYYYNLRKMEYLLGSPQRTFLKGLHYVKKSDGSQWYDTPLPDWYYYEPWY